MTKKFNWALFTPTLPLSGEKELKVSVGLCACIFTKLKFTNKEHARLPTSPINITILRNNIHAQTCVSRSPFEMLYSQF